MARARLVGVAVTAVLAAAAARAESPAIEHSEIKCLVAGKYRKMPAKFTPPEVAQPRVYFRPEGVPSWYYVEMKPDVALGQVGILPKPTNKMIQKHVEYYVEAASRDFDTGRTPEYAPIVVAKESECKNEPVVALYSKEPPSAVFPSVPEGFATGAAVGAGTVLGVVGGAAAVTGAVILAKGGDDNGPVVTPTPFPTPTPAATPTPPPTTAPVGPPLLSCQAEPRQGVVPLAVKFTAQASGGNGTFDFAWDFGDGDTSRQVNPSHTYTRPGTYTARVRATSADRSEDCSRTVSVLQSGFTLSVSAAGAGTGTITGNGINCPGDCSEVFAPGTVVTLTAAGTNGSTFTGWSGDCAGAGPCTVTMNAEHSVAATFAAPMFTLNVTINGSGLGTVTGPGIACPGTCTSSYQANTNITLTANPGASAFAGWGGDCAGNPGLTCNLTMNGDKNVIATFNQATFTLTVTVTQGPAGAGRVQILGPAAVPDCQSAPPPGNTCVTTWASGAALTLRPIATLGFFQFWGGDCAGTATVQGSNDCLLTMSQNHTATALFDNPAAAPTTSRSGTLLSRLEAPSTHGQVLLNGIALAPEAAGVTQWTVATKEGENRVEASFGGDGRAGTWRFELAALPSLAPGSLRVLAGEAVLVSGDAIVFRVSGRAGDRVSFAFDAR